MYAAAGYQPPSVDEVKARVTRNRAAVAELIELAAANGRLIRISPEFYLAAEAERHLRATISERLATGDGLTVSQVRELLATTRKYAVPLCEHLDRIGLTRRQGDLRVLAEAESPQNDS
jgi:selenocysteine-specific elongation factor